MSALVKPLEHVALNAGQELLKSGARKNTLSTLGRAHSSSHHVKIEIRAYACSYKMSPPLPLRNEAQLFSIFCNISLPLSIASHLTARIKPNLAIIFLGQSLCGFNPIIWANPDHCHPFHQLHPP